MKWRRNLLLLGMGLMIPCYLFTVGNVLLAPWTLYSRNRLLLFFLTVLAAMGLLCAMRAVKKPFFAQHERAMLLGAAVFYFTVQMAMGLSLRYTPITDTEQCFTAAQLIVDTGTFADTPRYAQYMSRYPHNLKLVYLLAGIFRFFGMFGWTDRYAQALLVNSLLFTVGLLAAARVAKRLGGASTQSRLLVLFASCLPFLYATTELYTDAFSIAFPTIVFYCACRIREAKRLSARVLWTGLFALAAFVGAQIRLTSLIAAIACLIAMLLSRKPSWTVAAAAALTVVFVLGGTALNAEDEKYLSRETIEKNKFPILHYIAMGLPVQSDEGYGQYGDGRWLLFTTSFEDTRERDAALRTEVIDRIYYLRYPNRLLHMMSRKNLSTFGNGTFGLGALIEADEKEPDNPVKQVIFSQGALYGAYYHVTTALFLAQMLIACLACAQRIHSRDTRGAALFITLVGAFLFLCIWETQPRYFFQFQMVLLCAAALFGGDRAIAPAL